MNSIKYKKYKYVKYKMDTIFMSSENSKTSDTHRLLFIFWIK